MVKVFAFFLSLFAIPAAQAEDLSQHIDYLQLDHTISLDSLRAGNHDAKGNNEYYFKATLHGLNIAREEREKGFEKRQKLSVELGEFAPLPLKPLSQWEPTDPGPSQAVAGDTIRQLVADAMRQFNVPEARIAVLVEVVMFEKEKKYWVLPNDRLIGSVKFMIIPETMPHAPDKRNQAQMITDELGTSVTLKLEYQTRDQNAPANNPASPAAKP